MSEPSIFEHAPTSWYKVIRAVEDERGRPLLHAGEIVAGVSMFAIDGKIEVMRRGSSRDPVEVRTSNLVPYNWPTPSSGKTFDENRQPVPGYDFDDESVYKKFSTHGWIFR